MNTIVTFLNGLYALAEAEIALDEAKDFELEYEIIVNDNIQGDSYESYL